MIGVIKYGEEFESIGTKEPIDDDYDMIGDLFYGMELHMYGLIVSTGDGLYKIVEE